MEQNQSKPKEERDKNINFCLVLRQMAAHPFLLESIIEKIFTKDNIKELQEELGSHGGQIPVYQQIGLCAAEDTTVDDPEITALDKSEPIFGQSAFGGKFVMSLQRLGNRIEGVRPCGICEQGVEKPFKLIPVCYPLVVKYSIAVTNLLVLAHILLQMCGGKNQPRRPYQLGRHMLPCLPHPASGSPTSRDRTGAAW